MTSYTITALGIGAGLIGLLTVGCVASEPHDQAQGTARVRLDIAGFTAAEITSVTVETDTGFAGQMTYDAASEAFTGVLTLPVGPHQLTGRAFAGADLIGISSPALVDIQADTVSQVTMRILDITQPDPIDHGPILEFLSHPVEAEAGTAVTFFASVLDPDGDAVSFVWSDDCADASFSNPQAATTEWTKATAGTCNITLTANAGGLGLVEVFSIDVFDPVSSSGDAEIDGVFVEAPEISLSLLYGIDTVCTINALSDDASCADPMDVSDFMEVSVAIEWYNGEPSEATISDDCAGAFSPVVGDAFSFESDWVPPPQAGLCFITVQATNTDGLVSEISAAVLVTSN